MLMSEDSTFLNSKLLTDVFLVDVANNVCTPMIAFRILFLILAVKGEIDSFTNFRSFISTCFRTVINFKILIFLATGVWMSEEI